MDRDAFLAATLPRLEAADTALHDGDPGPRIAMWSRRDPVTLFGAALSGTGWEEIGAVFARLGPRFSQCSGFRYEVLAAGASGDLGYIVGIEHTTASIDGAPPAPYRLRVTTVLRREDGEWRVVHRHADPDPADASARDGLSGLATDPGG
jgi:ketosteroid isomerase-like protein